MYKQLRLLEEVIYQDVTNALIDCDIVEESAENEKYYVLRQSRGIRRTRTKSVRKYFRR